MQDETGRYLFFLAGARHQSPPGELFYAGIGGHREVGEDWIARAHREAKEEISKEVEILSAPVTWYLPHQSQPQQIELLEQPGPLALDEMEHPSGARRAGQL